jgi:uncharacterized protein YggE
MSRPRIILAATALTLSLLALGGCGTTVVTADGATPLNTVTSSGAGEALAAPDMAEMYFGVGVLEPDAKAALDGASDVAAAITDAVKGTGIPAEDIQTANVSVYPEYRGGGEKAPEISGYRASVQVRVKIRDLEKIGDVIGAASDAGANEISGPSFMLDDDVAAQDEAIEDAIADARRRAETMAKAAGKTLGAIISVSEAGASAPPLYYEGARYAAADMGSVPIEPGQLNVNAGVTVVFELK